MERGVEMKKVHGAVALAVGIPCGAIGAALMNQGAFGLTPFYSVSLAVWKATGILSMGAWNTAFQVALIASLIVIVRKIKPRYALSFVAAAISSAILDAANGVCAGFSQAIPVRLICYTAGFFIMTFGIALMAECKLPVAPMNLFVRELSEEWRIPFRRIKLFFDVGCFLLSVVIALCFSHNLEPIGLGTLVSAALTGPLSGLYIREIRKHIQIGL